MVVLPRLPEVVPAARVRLRLWSPSDEPAMSAAIAGSVDHLRPWMPWAAAEPTSTEERLATIGHFRALWEAGTDGHYGIWLDDLVVGGCGLHRRGGPGTLEIGYWLHPEHTGKGFATGSAAALTAVALDQPEINKVEIHHDAANHASRRVPERLGYTLVEERPEERTAPGMTGVSWIWATDRSRPRPAAV